MSCTTQSTPQPVTKNLTIWQQNVNKSRNAQEDLLESLKSKNFHICAIQEPHIDFFNNTKANSKWRVVYPNTHYTNPKKTRSIILVNASILTNTWSDLATNSGDVTAIKLQTDTGTVNIFNIYNDINNDDALQSLSQAAQKFHSEENNEHMIWLGDFNRHHPFWDEDRNHHLFTPANIERAQMVLDLTMTHDMEMALPKDIPTLRALNTRNLTRPDNVFISHPLIDALTYCNTEPEKQPVNTDHFPIIVKIDTSVTIHEEQQRFNFKGTDWDEFRKMLKAKLDKIPKTKTIHSVDDFDQMLISLDRAVHETIEKVVPKAKFSPHTKRWWSDELKKLKKTVTKKGRKAYNQRFNPGHPAHGEYKRLRNEYTTAIREAKLNHWTEWLESLNGTTVWTAAKYANSDPTDASRARVPNLKAKLRGSNEEITATTNDLKSRMFYEALFPEKPPQDETLDSATYPEPKWEFKPISNKQIKRAIDNMPPYKATAPDTAPNCVLKEAKQLLLPYLGPLFRATFDLSYYPDSWAQTMTVILKKPSKPNYETPNAWRPISLSNGFARLLNACVANEITNRCETYNIIPKNHFGARPGHTTTQAVHYLTTTIKDTWRKKRVISALFLDVKGAFPSVSIDRLVHDMRTRGIPNQLTNWIAQRMSNRRTQLKFDDYTSDIFVVTNGLDQGDPLSPIAYMIYNSDVLDVPSTKNGEDAILFVDDTTILAIGHNYTETHRKIEEMLNRL